MQIKKKIIIIIAMILTFSIINMETIIAKTSANYDYEVTVHLNGTDKNTSEEKLSNVEIAKKIKEYYKNNKQEEKDLLYELSCTEIFGSKLQLEIFSTFINNIFFIILIVTIIILILFSMFDFTKGIISHDDDFLRKTFKNFKIRLISIVILILSPIILNTIISYINSISDENIKIGNTSNICSNEKINKNSYIMENKTIYNKNWSAFTIKDSYKENTTFLGWTTNKNGPSIIFKNKVYTSELKKEDLKLYSLFMDTNKEVESYGSVTLHNIGAKTKHFYLPKKAFITQTSKKGFNYFADYNEWYYLDEKNEIYKGIKKIDNKTYYFDKNGVMKFGWTKIESDTYYFNTKGEMVFGEQNIGGITYYFDEKTGALQKNTVMKYYGAVDVPIEILNIAPRSDLSIVVSEENGRVLAQRKPFALREGGSATKVFTGYAAAVLLDPEKDIITCTSYAQNMPYMGASDVYVGQKLTVQQAATRGFPGSSNVTTANIAIAIGKKYHNCSSDADAYNKGMEEINKLLKKEGCKQTHIPSSSGVNYNYTTNSWSFKDDGYSLGTDGITANDLTLIGIEAMKNKVFLESYIMNTHEDKELARNKNKDGLFWIKSGTQGYKHGIWAFNKNGKRYYITLLGVNFSVEGDKRSQLINAIHKWALSDLIK